MASRGRRDSSEIRPYVVVSVPTSQFLDFILSETHLQLLIHRNRMLLGGALTLGHELDLFDDNGDAPIDAVSNGSKLSFADYLLLRRSRLRRLLFVYISQLASRMGCAMPKTPFHTTISSAMTMPHSTLDHQWHYHMTSWIELSRLVRTSSEFLFPSKSVTRELLRSGRYCEFLDHFRPLLSQWFEKYSQSPGTSFQSLVMSLKRLSYTLILC